MDFYSRFDEKFLFRTFYVAHSCNLQGVGVGVCATSSILEVTVDVDSFLASPHLYSCALCGSGIFQAIKIAVDEFQELFGV